jgi:hypothetical protein
MRDVNYQLLISAARLLQPLLDELVFVGGCVTGLLITDEAVPAARPTLDVDAIVEITSYVGYVNFSARLQQIGFNQDSSEGAPACRWKNGDITLDVMPLNEKILGFSNRWYRAAAEGATPHPLAPLLQIRLITAPYFPATKLEAFRGRGKRDYFGSSDLEDVLSVVDGRPMLGNEVQASPIWRRPSALSSRTPGSSMLCRGTFAGHSQPSPNGCCVATAERELSMG